MTQSKQRMDATPRQPVGNMGPVRNCTCTWCARLGDIVMMLTSDLTGSKFDRAQLYMYM